MAEENDHIAMTIEVVASYVAHNTVRPEDLPGFIARTHAAIAALSTAPAPATDAAEPEPETTPKHQPAVTVRKSLASREHILSMVDGKPYKTLKRHIAGHGMTPAEYRERYGLKADYPMTAPAYSEQRREVARTLGLGRKPDGSAGADAQPAAADPAPAAAEPAKTRRPAKAKPANGGPDAPPAAKRRGRPPKSTARADVPADGTGQDQA